MNETERQIVAWLYREVDDIRIFVEQRGLHSGMARIGRKLIKAEHYKQIAQRITSGEHRQHSPAKDD